MTTCHSPFSKTNKIAFDITCSTTTFQPASSWSMAFKEKARYQAILQAWKELLSSIHSVARRSA